VNQYVHQQALMFPRRSTICSSRTAWSSLQTVCTHVNCARPICSQRKIFTKIHINKTKKHFINKYHIISQPTKFQTLYRPTKNTQSLSIGEIIQSLSELSLHRQHSALLDCMRHATNKETWHLPNSNSIWVWNKCFCTKDKPICLSAILTQIRKE